MSKPRALVTFDPDPMMRVAIGASLDGTAELVYLGEAGEAGREDIVVVSLPLTRATDGLIGRRELALMMPDAILIMVARAAIIDEDALVNRSDYVA